MSSVYQVCDKCVSNVQMGIKGVNCLKCVTRVSSGCLFVSSVCQVGVQCMSSLCHVCQVCQVCDKCVKCVSSESSVCQVYVKYVMCCSSL